MRQHLHGTKVNTRVRRPSPGRASSVVPPNTTSSSSRSGGSISSSAAPTGRHAFDNDCTPNFRIIVVEKDRFLQETASGERVFASEIAFGFAVGGGAIVVGRDHSDELGRRDGAAVAVLPAQPTAVGPGIECGEDTVKAASDSSSSSSSACGMARDGGIPRRPLLLERDCEGEGC